MVEFQRKRQMRQGWSSRFSVSGQGKSVALLRSMIRLSGCQCGEQCANFFLDLARRGNRVGNFHIGQGFVLQQPGKKLLGRILRVMRTVAPPAHEGIDWLPVSAAKLFESASGVRGIAAARRRHDAPMREREPARAGLRRWAGRGWTLCCHNRKCARPARIASSQSLLC